MSNHTPKRIPISSQLAAHFNPPGLSVVHIRAAVATQEKNGQPRTEPAGTGPYGLGVQGVQFGSTVVTGTATANYAY
jgi:hypothetical protein